MNYASIFYCRSSENKLNHLIKSRTVASKEDHSITSQDTQKLPWVTAAETSGKG